MLDTRKLQRRLAELGFYKGKIDGIVGPATERAIVAFKVSKGMVARPYLGPLTLAALWPTTRSTPEPALDMVLPWLNELSKHMRLHETRDFAKLFAWLRSDGKSVGDPRKYPWCGDAIETAVKLSLPNEPFTGPLATNPYLARNWLHFGKDCGPRYGAITSFWRGTKHGLSGHVGTAIGYDPKLKKIRVRGGNQSDTVSDAWLDEARLLGYRAPITWPQELPPLPAMNSAGAIISTNEA